MLVSAPLLACVALFWLIQGTDAQSQADHHLSLRPAPAAANPDAVCASCHREIYDKYEQTPMAQASGLAPNGLLQGSLHHVASGVDYRIFLRDGLAWMSYDRAASGDKPALHGEEELIYFVGSGKRGRTYLYKKHDQAFARWFEAPINYYSRKEVWDMAPGYEAVTSMPPDLMIEPNCLHCHTTGVQPALPQARNLYADSPFQQGGIGCSSCHGDATRHLAERGKGPIVNPGKLDPTKRDSICLQCHVEGVAVVFHDGRSLANFKPGENLGDFATYFVSARERGGTDRVTSQYEALLLSACKKASGDKLTCTTCHDPHKRPAESERVAYFRSRCLSCHTGTDIATKHHPEQQDCAACHMPSRMPTDISHEQSTDHNIQRRPVLRDPAAVRTNSIGLNELVTVGGGTATSRDLGLAYAQSAKRGDRSAGEKALRLLRRAEAEGADDAELHVELGFLQQKAGNAAISTTEYEAALRSNPYDASALSNLAVIRAREGRIAEAEQLFARVVDADPTQLSAALNLAMVACSTGERQKAIATLARVAEYAPDDPAIRKFLATGNYAGMHCSLQ